MSTTHEGLHKYAEYSNSWITQVKEAKSQVEGLDWLFKIAKDQEVKLKKEVVALGSLER